MLVSSKVTEALGIFISKSYSKFTNSISTYHSDLIGFNP